MDKITIERSIWIAAPRERVWLAVTDPVQMAAWFSPGTIISQKDDTISVRMGDQDIPVAQIEVVDPPRQVTTRNLMEVGRFTTYTLEEENGGTRFTVIESGLESLSPDERQKKLTENGAGWQIAVENLKAYIEGQPLPHPAGL